MLRISEVLPSREMRFSDANVRASRKLHGCILRVNPHRCPAARQIDLDLVCLLTKRNPICGFWDG